MIIRVLINYFSVINPRCGGELKKVDPPDLETQALRAGLSRLSEASLRINESLDYPTVLQGSWTRPGP